MNRLSPSLSKARPVGHNRRRGLSVGGITRYWCHGYRTLRQRTDVTSDTANSISIEIDLIRHRLDAKNLFTVNRWRGCTVGSRSSYFPNSSLTRHSVTNPEVSLLIEGDEAAAPGTPEAKMVAMGGFLALGLNV